MIPFHGIRLGAAMALFGATCLLFSQAISPFLEPWRAHSYAAEQAEARGIADWQLDSTTDDSAGTYRFLFQNPADPESFADMTVTRQGNEWVVTKFNKDFRPWQSAEPTR